jgi:hypothetical protein
MKVILIVFNSKMDFLAIKTLFQIKSHATTLVTTAFTFISIDKLFQLLVNVIVGGRFLHLNTLCYFYAFCMYSVFC